VKLIIQIPCLNEEETLPITLADLPEEIEGIDDIEILVIDDGSTDRTVEVAREHGVHHIVSMTKRKGLAEAFMAGLDAAVKLGADIIVNTDGDNQCRAACFGNLGAGCCQWFSGLQPRKPLKVFMQVGLAIFLLGVLISLRFLYYFLFIDGGAGHIQSLILSAVLMLIGFQVSVFGVLADLIAGHRNLTESVLYRVKKLEVNLLKLHEDSKPAGVMA